MTDPNHAKKQPHTAPADAASPFFTFQQLFRTEMNRVLDESAAGFEKSAAEFERIAGEANRFGAGQTKAMHEASRAWIAGVRTMMG